MFLSLWMQRIVRKGDRQPFDKSNDWQASAATTWRFWGVRRAGLVSPAPFILDPPLQIRCARAAWDSDTQPTLSEPPAPLLVRVRVCQGHSLGSSRLRDPLSLRDLPRDASGPAPAVGPATLTDCRKPAWRLSCIWIQQTWCAKKETKVWRSTGITSLSNLIMTNHPQGETRTPINYPTESFFAPLVAFCVGVWTR